MATIKGCDVLSVEIGTQVLPIAKDFKKIGTVLIFGDSKAHLTSGEVKPVILVNCGASWYISNEDCEIDVCELVTRGDASISPEKVPIQFIAASDEFVVPERDECDERDCEDDDQKNDDIASCFAVVGFAIVAALVSYGFLFATHVILP